MADYFVRGTTGSDAANGLTGATAKQHHSSVASLTPAAGSTINHAETQEATAVATFTGASLTFKNEDGAGGLTPAVIRGVLFPTFLATGVRSYRADIGSGKTVAAVRDRWLSRVDAYGRHYGYMVPLASAAAVDTETTGLNGYFYDGTQYLYVQLSDGTNPTTLTGDNRVGWIQGGGIGAINANGGSSIIQDIKSECVRPAGSTATYQFQFTGGSNIARRLTGIDPAVHSVAFLSSANDLLEDSLFYGGGQLTGAGLESNTPAAAHTTLGNLSGLRIKRCTFHCYTHLGPTGVPLNTHNATSVSGFTVHTDGVGSHYVTDVQMEDCWSHHYEQDGSLMTITNCDPAAISNHLNPDAYPARVIRGGMRGCNQLSLDTHMSYRNTFIDLTKFEPTDQLYAAFLFSTGVVRNISFFGCTLIFDQGNLANRFMFRLQANAWLTLINCTIINRGLNTTGPHQFISVANSTNKVTARRCIFYNAVATPTNTRLLTGDSGSAQSNFDFRDNIYFGINSSNWSSDATRNTQAEFFATTDLTGQYLDPMIANPQSVDPQFAGMLSPASPLLNPGRKVIGGREINLGINGRRYDGTIGSWQYGSPVISGSGGGGGGAFAAGIAVGSML